MGDIPKSRPLIQNRFFLYALFLPRHELQFGYSTNFEFYSDVRITKLLYILFCTAQVTEVIWGVRHWRELPFPVIS